VTPPPDRGRGLLADSCKPFPVPPTLKGETTFFPCLRDSPSPISSFRTAQLPTSWLGETPPFFYSRPCFPRRLQLKESYLANKHFTLKSLVSRFGCALGPSLARFRGQRTDGSLEYFVLDQSGPPAHAEIRDSSAGLADLPSCASFLRSTRDLYHYDVPSLTAPPDVWPIFKTFFVDRQYAPPLRLFSLLLVRNVPSSSRPVYLTGAAPMSGLFLRTAVPPLCHFER